MTLGITLFAGITASITSFLIAPPGTVVVMTARSIEEDQVHQLVALRDAGILSREEWQNAVARVGKPIASEGMDSEAD